MYNSHIRLILKTILKLEHHVKDISVNLSKNVSPIHGTTQVRRKSERAIFTTSRKYTALPSPEEVTAILRTNEFSQEFTSGSVKSYDSNQLASNSPIEDMRSEALCTFTSGILMGVYDGHIGPECAQVISKRLLNYIAASLLPLEKLEQHLADGANRSLIHTINDKVIILDELKAIYENSFKLFLRELVTAENVSVAAAIERAFVRLDSDLSREVLEQYEITKTFNPETLSVAMSGAVTCISHIDGPHLHVASVGDCNAVLGIMTDEKEWKAKKITKEHNSDNFDELNRIRSEHPDVERKTVIKGDRLLGELAPLRSIGDYRYKWPVEILQKVAKTKWAEQAGFVGRRAIPMNYLTPPYLTARPDIYHHRLTTKDKFLIIASDGIWDTMTPLQAVKLVGEHIEGKVFLNQLKLPQRSVQLGEINEILLNRKQSLRSKPKDRNSATHLIRHALGVDHSISAQLLSLTPDVSRYFRDDMTVTVVFFDSEFLRQCPA